jgi:hypothetical protein
MMKISRRGLSFDACLQLVRRVASYQGIICISIRGGYD